MSKDETIFTVDNLSCELGENQVFQDVNFVLRKREILGLIGPSGGGKSVLLKNLAEVLPPSSGSIQTSVHDKSEVSLMFQEGALFDSLSVLDNVAFPLVDGKVPCSTLPYEKRKVVVREVEEILEKVGLEDHSAKVPAQLSGGMRRRVSLARALVSKPKVGLLDDPTCGLDPVASSVIMELITDLHASLDISLLLVSHDLRRLLPICHRMIALFDGTIVFDGPVSELEASAPEEVQHFVACRYDIDGVDMRNADGIRSGDVQGGATE